MHVDSKALMEEVIAIGYPILKFQREAMEQIAPLLPERIRANFRVATLRSLYPGIEPDPYHVDVYLPPIEQMELADEQWEQIDAIVSTYRTTHREMTERIMDLIDDAAADIRFWRPGNTGGAPEENRAIRALVRDRDELNQRTLDQIDAIIGEDSLATIKSRVPKYYGPKPLEWIEAPPVAMHFALPGWEGIDRRNNVSPAQFASLTLPGEYGNIHDEEIARIVEFIGALKSRRRSCARSHGR